MYADVFIPECSEDACSETEECPVSMDGIPSDRSVRVNMVWYDARSLATWFKQSSTAPHSRLPVKGSDINRIRARARVVCRVRQAHVAAANRDRQRARSHPTRAQPRGVAHPRWR